MHITTVAIAQGGMKLITENKKAHCDTCLRYHFADRPYWFMGADLYLYANGRFFLRSYTDISHGICEGEWNQEGNIFNFSGDLKNKLPVVIRYQPRTTGSGDTQSIAIIRDLNSTEYRDGAILINHDSVSCFYGNLSCLGTYQTIDSIKIVINNDVSSPWIRVNPALGIIVPEIQTKLDLNNFMPFNTRMRREKNRLIEL